MKAHADSFHRLGSLIRIGVSALALVATGAATAAVYDREEEPNGDRVAAFRLFVPDEVKSVRAVIVLMPGSEGDGKAMAADPDWCAFAAKHDVALLACFFKGRDYYQVRLWAGRVLMNNLKQLAADSGHRELAEAPLAFWGHSAGGQFNYNFACFRPARTLAFIANKGAYYEAPSNVEVRTVPALWITGAEDTELRINNITSLYAINRRFGALWALTIEPGVGHEVATSKQLGLAFLEDVLALRLDDAGRFLPADPAKGWLGDLRTATIEKASATPEDRRAQVWLPGEATALLWAKVMRGEAGINGEAAP